MWKLYSESGFAVAIQSTYPRLVDALPGDGDHPCYVGVVNYTDYRTEGMATGNSFHIEATGLFRRTGGPGLVAHGTFADRLSDRPSTGCSALMPSSLARVGAMSTVLAGSVRCSGFQSPQKISGTRRS